LSWRRSTAAPAKRPSGASAGAREVRGYRIPQCCGWKSGWKSFRAALAPPSAVRVPRAAEGIFAENRLLAGVLPRGDGILVVNDGQNEAAGAVHPPFLAALPPSIANVSLPDSTIRS